MPDRNSPQFQKAVRDYQNRAAKGWQMMDDSTPAPRGVKGPGQKHKGLFTRKGSLRKAVFGNKSNGSSFGKHRG